MAKSTASRVLLTLFRILFTLFVLWTILFIFRNSLESGVLSSARSQAVTAAVNQHLGRVGLSPLSNALVRKLAHFGEYLLLGFGYTLCLRVYTRRYIRHISWPLLLGLLVANVDETLQCYVAGRSSSLRDGKAERPVQPCLRAAQKTVRLLAHCKPVPYLSLSWSVLPRVLMHPREFQ